MLSMTVRLRSLCDADLEHIFEWERDPRAVTMAAFTRADPADRSTFDRHYQRIRNDPDCVLRGIEAGGVLVGTIASFTMEGDREVAYWIDPTRWGQGFASRALGAFLDVERARPLFAHVAEHNTRSAGVLAGAGFVKIGSQTAYAPGVGREIVEDIYRLPRVPGDAFAGSTSEES